MLEHKRLILHVDDDEANRYAVTRSLTHAGFEVIEAADGGDALRKVAAKPELVILDIRLPDMSGFEICRIIKADPQTAHIPVLHLSASFTSGEDKAHGLDSGADGYLVRPVEPVELIATVNALLRAKESEDALRRSEEQNRQLIENLQRAALEREALLKAEQAARADAERAGIMKDEFLATLSHELRTPLNAILGWAAILRGGEVAEHDLREGLDVIERNARAQTQIIEDLLDMSRIISGKVRLDILPLDLAATLQAAMGTIKPAADAKSVRLQASVEPVSDAFRGDGSRLQQVFWNLLTNAVKFTPKGGQVEVRLRSALSHVEINVIDSGEGIPATFLPHVFDRFRQADASTTRRHGGLGLGLAIVKQLVELHGGEVRVMSEGAGKGSTFTVILPVRSAVAAAAPSPAEETDPVTVAQRTANEIAQARQALAGARIVVVDDEPDARILVRRLLEDCGATVMIAASCEAGVSAVMQHRPDLLISDIGMPEVDGYALIGRVRALRPDDGGRTPALALTAYARSEDRTRSLLAGFQRHLSKPVDPSELIVMAAELTAGRHRG